MPVVYYTYYTPESNSILEISHQEHNLGRRLLTHGLKELHQISLSPEELDLSLATEENGKPYLNLSDHPNICFNISHCDGLVACAFHNSPIGIDVELPGYFPEVLIDRALTEKEKDFLNTIGVSQSLKEEWFYRLWTLKEAYVKKTGVGVDAGLKDFSFTIKQEEDMHILCSNPSVICHQVKLENGHILSLCYEDYSSNSKNNVVYLPMS